MAPSVLLVEHDDAVAELARRYLAREGFTVRIAATAAEAADALGQLTSGRYRPDVVVLDLTMPGLSAREIRRALCQPDAARGGAPGSTATGRPAAGSRAAGSPAAGRPARGSPAAGRPGSGRRGRPGAIRPVVCLAGPGGLRPPEAGVPDSACLPRPFGPRTLVARVRAALATDGVSASATGSDHALQPFADVALTATERELLAVLLASPGRVFTRERLLAAIAVTADGPGPRAVDVYVSQLRAKLGDRSPIRTARGVGYSAQPQRPQQRRD